MPDASALAYEKHFSDERDNREGREYSAQLGEHAGNGGSSKYKTDSFYATFRVSLYPNAA